MPFSAKERSHGLDIPQCASQFTFGKGFRCFQFMFMTNKAVMNKSGQGFLWGHFAPWKNISKSVTDGFE